jgi:hypothetical protein
MLQKDHATEYRLPVAGVANPADGLTLRFWGYATCFIG